MSEPAERLRQAEALERMLYWEQLRVNGLDGADYNTRQGEVVTLLGLWRDTVQPYRAPVLPSWALSYIPPECIRQLGFAPNGTLLSASPEAAA